jgi:DNA-binding CsgD family transcriptional regulator
LRLIGGRGSGDLLLAGAVKARSRQDHPLAEQLARAAIDEGAGFEARVLAAEAARAQGRHAQAESELAALAAQAPSDAERARVAILRFDNAFRLDGRAELGLIDDAVAAITDPSLRDELLTRRVYVLHASRGPRAGLEAASALIPHLEAAPPGVAHIVLSFALARRGRIDEALELLGQPLGSTSTPAIDESWVEWNLFGLRAVVRLYAGALGEAEELLSRGYRLVVDEPAAEARAYVAGGLSVVYLQQGRAMSAARRATEAYTLYRQLGRDYAALWPYSFAVHALALSGQPSRAAETLVARDALGLPTALLYEGDLLQARAWTAAASGDLPAARVQLYAAADLGEEIGDLIGATSALHGLARLGRARKVAARLAALAKEVDGAFATARAAYANAVAASDSAALDEVAQSFEHLGAILYAAEATAEAAVILRHDGEARKGAAAELKAARLLARCEGATTPPVQLITARVRLTPGELDASVQAAAGRTNKQIASDMHLSVRTVESHLQRAYEKLGISGRRALADALQDLPAP